MNSINKVLDIENSFININLLKSYVSSEEFWKDNQFMIYSKIIKIFKKFLVSSEDLLGMTVTTKIDGYDQKIYFGFDKDQPEILVELLMPYYIECEEYEICIEIQNLYKELEVHNKDISN